MASEDLFKLLFEASQYLLICLSYYNVANLDSLLARTTLGVSRLLVAEGSPFCRRMLRDLVCALGNGSLLHSLLSLAIQELLTF